MSRRAVSLLALLSLVMATGRLAAQQAAAEPKWSERIRFEGDFRPRFDMTYHDLGEGKEDEDLRRKSRSITNCQ